ncbi:MAG: hypothetical protein AB1637_02225 [Elusimicrobiota bacterium]
MTNKRSFYFFFFSGLILSFPFFLLGINNPDIFWHLSSGKYIFENLSIPKTDFISWTMSGKYWADFEWLTQIIYYALYKNFSMESLYFLKILLISASLFIFSLILKEKEVPNFHLFWILPLVSACNLTSSDVRPENFSVLFFLILWLTVIKKEPQQKSSQEDLIFYFLFFSFWTNIHGGFIYGLILLFIKFCGDMLDENLPFAAGKASFSFVKSKKNMLSFVAAAAGTLINPYGYKIYSVMTQHFAHSSSYSDFLLEWRDLDITIPYFRPFVFLLLSFPIVYLIDFLKKRKVVFFEIFLAVFFSFAALFHLRNLVFASYVLIILSSSFLKEIRKTIYFAFLSAVFIFALSAHFFSAAAKDYADFKIENFYFSSPKLISFLKENEKELSGLKMYNSWAWGGYLGKELYPSYKIFIDGRYIFSPMLSEFVAAKNSLNIWKETLKKYGFSLIVSPPSVQRFTVIKKLKDGSRYAVNMPLYLLQLPKEDWALVYFDKKNIVAVKRKEVSATWLKKNEFEIIAPFAMDNLDYPVYMKDMSLKKIEKEILKYSLSNTPGEKDSMALEMLDWLNKTKESLKGKKK